MKWVTHIVWGAAVLRFFGAGLPTAFALASLHTVFTDVLGHRGLRRAWYHDILSIIIGILLGLYVGLPMPASLALGLTHVVLDWISPGRLAVSWLYNLPFLALGLALLQLS